MRRGDLVTIANPGDYGKPRPALVIQSELLEEIDTVVVIPLTSKITESPRVRPLVLPDTGNGLRKPSRAMIDKIVGVRRDRVGAVFGRIDESSMVAVTGSLAVFLGMM